MSRVWRNLGRLLLDHESKIFAVVLGLLAVDEWRTLVMRTGEYWVYLVNGVYGSPLLSLLVTALSASYMTIIVFILLAAGRPLARYETPMPNLSAAVGGFAVYLFGVLKPAATPLVSIYIPLVLLAAGAAIVLWALWYLRRAFSVVPQARTVVANGPYRYVRHPMYVGNMLTIVGLGLIVGTLSALFLSLICLALQVARARYEDRLLASTFNEYGAYMSRVNAFFPRLCSRRVIRMAVIVSATVIAGSAAAYGPKPPRSPARRWRRNAKRGTARRSRANGSPKRRRKSMPAPTAIRKVSNQFQPAKNSSPWRTPARRPQSTSSRRSLSDKSHPSADYIKANERLVKIVDQVPGCKSIAGFDYVCPALRMQSRRGKTLSPKLKSVLGECADASIGKTTSGLIRGAL